MERNVHTKGILRSQFIDNFVYIKGKKFSFPERKYLLPVVDSPYKTIVIKAGRQTEKSTLLAAIATAEMCLIPFFSVLYVTLSGQQISDFSNDKLHNILQYSPLIHNRFYAASKGTVIKRIRDKSLLNGAHIAMRSAFRNAETIRGISADRLIVDECQSILPENIIIAQECISRSRYKFSAFTGTAKTDDNPMEYYWGKSTQCEWMIKCTHCGFYNYQDEKILARDHLRCTKCDSMIDVNNGIWVPLTNSPDVEIAGYRLTQYMLYGVNYRELYAKLQEYPIAKFYNEVLGLPYSQAVRPIDVHELIKLCDSRRKNEAVRLDDSTLNIMGVDWGSGTRSYTVAVVGSMEGDKIHIRFAKRFAGTDPLGDLEELAKIAIKMNVHGVFTDWGFGFIANEELRAKLREYNIQVAPVYYAEGSVERVRWDGTKYKVHRTKTLSRLFEKLKQGKFSFFSWAEFETFAKDILNVIIDHREGIGRQEMYYTHSPDRPDDFLHALNYVHIGMMLSTGNEASLVS